MRRLFFLAAVASLITVPAMAAMSVAAGVGTGAVRFVLALASFLGDAMASFAPERIGHLHLMPRTPRSILETRRLGLA